MHRVRLLRHHQIEPYIVFDGGPLPAKKGTEVERKQRREEGLKKGNALTAQGKHSLARECYSKCVDVTPQMAFQLIKVSFAQIMPPIPSDTSTRRYEKSQFPTSSPHMRQMLSLRIWRELVWLMGSSQKTRTFSCLVAATSSSNSISPPGPW
jgi:hypothetical protein